MTRKDFTHYLTAQIVANEIGQDVFAYNRFNKKVEIPSHELITEVVDMIGCVYPFDDEQVEDTQAEQWTEDRRLTYDINEASEYLDGRCIRALKRAGINTIGDLVYNIKYKKDAARIQGLGKHSISRIMELVDDYNKAELRV